MVTATLFDDPHILVNGRRASLRRKELALVAYLALDGSGSVSREALATLFWGEKDESAARHSLRQALLVLRRELGDHLVESPTGLRLVPAADCDLLDLERDGLLREGDQAPLPDRLLPGFDDLGSEPFSQWLASRRAAYRARFRGALSARRDAAIATAQWRDAERCARGLEADLPLDADSVVQLVRTLRRAGAEADAAAVLAAALPRFESNGLDASALHALARARHTPSTRTPATKARADLVGRDRELAALRGWWDEAVEGGADTVGVGVVLTGIDGIGRTRLVEDLARAIPAAARRLVWIRASEGGEAIVQRVTRALLEARGAAAADPAVITRTRDAIEDGRAAAPADLAAVIAAIAAERPLLLVLDDADLWTADAEPLRNALLAPPGRTMVIVSSWRALAVPRGVHRLALAGLGREAIATLLSSVLPLEPDATAALASHFAAATDGHPAWILALVDRYRTDGVLVPSANGAWALHSLPDSAPVPADLRDAISERLDALPPDQRAVLDRISGAPEGVAGATVAALGHATGLGHAALVAALDALVRDGLLRAATAPDAAYTIAHVVIQRVARESLHPARLWSEAESRRGRGWTRWALAATALLFVVGAWRGPWRAPSPVDASPPLIALEPLAIASTPDSSMRPIDEMLATNLARIEGIAILPPAPPGLALDSTRTALRAGAALVISGSVSRRGGSVRLDLRLTERRDGRIRHGIVVEAGDLFAAVDQATAELAEALGRRMPSAPLAHVSTASLAAFESYERGERSRAMGDRVRAIEWLVDAIRADPSFALARLRLAQAIGEWDKATATAQLDTALRAADRLPERERLLVRAERALLEEDPVREVLADSLVRLWPLDPNGHLLLGQALVWRGDFAMAARAFERAIMLDAPGLERSEVSCLACDAYEGLINAHLLADSLAAATRVAREWQTRQPDAGRAAAARSTVAQHANDLVEAAAAARRAVVLNPADPYQHVYEAVWAIRSGEEQRAVALLAEELRHPDPARRRHAAWFAAIAERNAGRPDLAERRLRALLDSIPAHERAAWSVDRMQQAQALLEAGRPVAAAALFDSLAQQNGPVHSPHAVARWRAWMGTLAADALAASGDTLALARRAQEIEAWGVQSAYGRDRLLHHHVRGLLLRARGDLEGARRAFEAARWSPTGSYARTQLALADVLLLLERPRDALGVLHQASHGSLESVHLYGTRRDLHERFARAFSAAGFPDSAAIHVRWVERASR
ncbi:MAG: AAA family ATPase [Gemmatimonadaceae bacterium]|jgi:DNA-binding SARP family transcriptional activator/tetratricopeptide (TPR) repeat protein|nr:AAA family ATPase [Gemmatimonadaceae bacterium]